MFFKKKDALLPQVSLSMAEQREADAFADRALNGKIVIAEEVSKMSDLQVLAAQVTIITAINNRVPALGADVRRYILSKLKDDLPEMLRQVEDVKFLRAETCQNLEKLQAGNDNTHKDIEALIGDIRFKYRMSA